MVQINVISQLLQQQMRPAESTAEPQQAGAFAALFAALSPVPEATPVKHSLLPSAGGKTLPHDDLVTLPEQPPGPPFFAEAVALPVPTPAPVTDNKVPGPAVAPSLVSAPAQPVARPAAPVINPAPTAAAVTVSEATPEPVKLVPTQGAEQAVKASELAQATASTRATAAELRDTMQPVAPVVSQQASASATLRPGATTEPVLKPVTAATSGSIQIVMTEASAATSAPVATSQPSTPAAPPQLTASVGSQAWQNQLQQNMVQMVMHNQQQVTLRLNPADLGPIQMQLQLDDTSAQLNILTHSHQVRGALEMAMPQLREALASQGIQLTDSQVGQQSSQQQQSQQSASQQRAMQWSAASGELPPAADSASLAPASGDSEHKGQVDIYA